MILYDGSMIFCDGGMIFGALVLVVLAQDGVIVMLREGDFDDSAVAVGRSGGDLMTKLVAKRFRNIEAHAG